MHPPMTFEDRIVSRLTKATTKECSLCYEATGYVSKGACGHCEICWICCLRLRLILKDKSCAICKEELQTVSIVPADARESESVVGSIGDVAFTNIQVLKEAQRLTSYVCPYPCGDSEAFDFKTLGDLQTHLKRDHFTALFCSICVDYRQCFLPEQVLYSPASLTQHNKKEHPNCDFCSKDRRFYSFDELVGHLNQAHFKCIVCDRLDHRNEYYANFDSLDRHFAEAHYRCEYPECREQRFVVFGDEEDLRLHWLEKHGRGRSVALSGGSSGINTVGKRTRNKLPRSIHNTVVNFRGPKVPASPAHTDPVSNEIAERYAPNPAGRSYDKRVHANVIPSVSPSWKAQLGECLTRAHFLTTADEDYKSENISFLKKLTSKQLNLQKLKQLSVDFTQAHLFCDKFLDNVNEVCAQHTVEVLTDLIRLMPDLKRRTDLVNHIRQLSFEAKPAKSVAPSVKQSHAPSEPAVEMPDTLFEAGSTKPCLIQALHAILSNADTQVVASKDLPQSTLSAMENKIHGLDRIQLTTLAEMRNHLLTLAEGRVSNASWTASDSILALRPLLYRLMLVPDSHKSRQSELIKSGWIQFVETAMGTISKFNKIELLWMKAYVALSVLRLSTMGPLDRSKRMDFPSLPMSAYMPGSAPTSIVAESPVVRAPTRSDFPVGLPIGQQTFHLVPNVSGRQWRNSREALHEDAFPELEAVAPPAFTANPSRPWNCPRCTFLNTLILCCEICGHDRPALTATESPQPSVSSVGSAVARPKRTRQKIILSSSTQRDYTR